MIINEMRNFCFGNPSPPIPVDLDSICFNDNESVLTKEHKKIQEFIMSHRRDAMGLEVHASLSIDSWLWNDAWKKRLNAIITAETRTNCERFQWTGTCEGEKLEPFLEPKLKIGLDFCSQKITICRQNPNTNQKQIEELKDFILKYEHNQKEKNLAENAITDKGESFNRIQQLNLTARALNQLPESICLLKNLVHLDLSVNFFKEIPNQVYKLEKLKVLILRSNEINDLPEPLLKLNLNKLEIRGNPIQKVPASFKDIVRSLPTCHSIWVD